MKWGTKWGTQPSGARSFWGVLLNEVTQTANFSQSVSGTVPVDCDTNYVIVPALGSRINTVFTYPYDTPARTLALRNPKFGNSYTMDTETIVRRNKARELLTFRYSNWPTFESMKFTMEKLSPTNKNDIIDFIKLSAGKEIGLLDYLDRQWKGLLIQPTVDIIKQGADDCTYEVSFEFIGALV